MPFNEVMKFANERYPVNLLDIQDREVEVSHGASEKYKDVIYCSYSDYYVGLIQYTVSEPLHSIEYNSFENGQKALEDLLSLSLTNSSQVIKYLETYGVLYTGFLEFIYRSDQYSDYSQECNGYTYVDSRNGTVSQRVEVTRSVWVQPYSELIDLMLMYKSINKLMNALRTRNWFDIISSLLIIMKFEYYVHPPTYREPISIRNNTNSVDEMEYDILEDDIFYQIFSVAYGDKTAKMLGEDFYKKIKIDYKNERVLFSSNDKKRLSNINDTRKNEIIDYAKSICLSQMNISLEKMNLSIKWSKDQLVSQWSPIDLNTLLYFELYLTFSQNEVWRICARDKCRKAFKVPYKNTRKIYHDTYCAALEAQRAYRERQRKMKDKKEDV